jgi:hypothetical protein
VRPILSAACFSQTKSRFYGRVRFHHRSTQEYLTADWLDALLKANCPLSEVRNLFFAEPYGVETVVPSLRPVAAWLSLRRPDIRQEMIRREPLVLIGSGDPGSLPLEIREKLLAAYAAKHAAAEIADDHLDSRSLWMFADQRLAPAIKRAWKANSRISFHSDLLRLIRDGASKDCVDLARKVALDTKAERNQRILALDTLLACGANDALAAAARQLTRNPAKIDARLAAAFSTTIYPQHLSTTALLSLIAKSVPPPPRSTGGFGYSLRSLYEAAPSATEQARFIAGLAELCLTPPFVACYQRISQQFRFIAGHVHDIAVAEVKRCGGAQPERGLIRLLMVTERAERKPSLQGKEENLFDLVNKNPALYRALFWADIEEQRLNASPEQKPIRFWQTGCNHTLWHFGLPDLEWLYAELQARPAEDDRRVVLSAIASILRPKDERDPAAERLRAIIAGTPILETDLDGYLAAPVEDQATAQLRRAMAARDTVNAAQVEKDKESWRRFEAHLRSDPSLLSDPKNLGSWKAGLFRFHFLMQWLQRRSHAHDEKALRDWRLLEEGFGRAVAEAFRDGLRQLWRISRPHRPKREVGGHVSVRWETILAFGAIGVEAAEDSDWTSQLTDKDAKRAAEHGCVSEQGYPDWLDELVGAFPQAVLPPLRQAIKHEWICPLPAASYFLHHYALAAPSIQPPVQTALLNTIMKEEAGLIGSLDRGVDIVRKLGLSQEQKDQLIRTVRSRLAQHRRAKRFDFALRYLAMLLLLEPNRAIMDLTRWIKAAPTKDRQERAEQAIGKLFDRHNPMATAALERASVPALEALLHLAYQHIHMSKDAKHEGAYTPDRRDHAESARDAVLSAVMSRTGADAYRVMCRAADHPYFSIRAERFKELARKKAERDAELPPWQPAEVVAFEKSHVVPVKTGTDLLRLALVVLDDINVRLTSGDVTSRPLLERAKDEDEVQNWLVEQMNFVAKDRYYAHREAQVADDDKPDVIISSMSAPVQVAIEIKHGGKGWTVRQLEAALKQQLAVNYLKPSTRRHGILVVTHHRDRKWVDPTSRKPMTFENLIERLSSIAATLDHNAFGATINRGRKVYH